jgi:ParB/RepB/Spo0J family partition protein
MDLEFHQIDLRYEHLRRRDPQAERQLLASLAQDGQNAPVVVLALGPDRYVLLDGYKRFRALRRLKRDTLQATLWDLGEVDALLLERMMRTSEPDSALEEAWFLCELRDRFRMPPEELARRFGRTPSWVSRRLALVEELPGEIQEHVLLGRLSAHTAMKVLVPLARANRKDCLRLCAALLKAPFTTREAVALKAAWLQSPAEARERLVADPVLFLRAQRALAAPEGLPNPFHLWLEDLGTLAAVARRAKQNLGHGALLLHRAPAEVQEASAALRQAAGDCQALFQRSERELTHA